MPARDEAYRGSRPATHGELASPFLEEELFAEESDAEWEAHLSVLEAESPFRHAFEQGVALFAEREGEGEENVDEQAFWPESEDVAEADGASHEEYEALGEVPVPLSEVDPDFLNEHSAEAFIDELKLDNEYSIEKESIYADELNMWDEVSVEPEADASDTMLSADGDANLVSPVLHFESLVEDEMPPQLFDAELPEAEEEVDLTLELPTVPSQGWVIPADVLAAGNTHSVRYDDSGPWNDGTACASAITAGADELRRYMMAEFRGIRIIGGFNCRRNTARANHLSMHGTGRALDVMIPMVGGRANSAIGDPIANWLVKNAETIGMQYLIWNRVRWSGKRTPRFARYSGPNPHTDHLHVELTMDAAARRTPWFTSRGAAPAPSPAPSPGTPTINIDAERAVRANRTHGARLGWQGRLPQIHAFLGVSGNPPHERDFALAVAAWQNRKGLEVDGILGPRTWAALHPALQPVESTLPQTQEVRVEHVAKGGDKSMNLERGVKVKGLARFQPSRSEGLDVVLAATGAAEGGYDSVNMYDKGILSWGIMQWTLHAGSLQKLLTFIKSQLASRGQSTLWAELFPELDVRNNQIVYQGEVVTTTNNRRLREIFRGAAAVNDYKKDIAEHWVRIFAQAGRHPVIQQLQAAHARKEVDNLLSTSLGAALAGIKQRCEKKPKGGTWDYVCPRLPEQAAAYRSRYRTIRDYIGQELKAVTLFFGMKVNNPTGAFVHLKQAIDALASKYGTHDITRWPGGWEAALSNNLEDVFRGSTFAMWGDAKAKKAGRSASRTECGAPDLGMYRDPRLHRSKGPGQ
jgi:hypothetical protein